MLAAYARRGLKAGLVAGLAFGLFMALVGNPLVGFADELAHEGGPAVETADHTAEHYEEAGHHDDPGHDSAGAEGGEHHESAVTSAVTNLVSVGSGVLWGVFLGIVVFGAGFYFLEPAIPGTGATKRIVLAGAGFLTVSGAPWLALPPHPPGVEQALPTGTRIAIYAVMMVAAAFATGAAWSLYARLGDRASGLARIAPSLTPYALLPILAVAAPTNPVTNPLPGDLSAAVTGVIVVSQAALWLALATVQTHVSSGADGQDAVDSDAGIDDHAPLAD